MVFLPVLLSIVGPKAYVNTEGDEKGKDAIASESPKQDAVTSKVQPDTSPAATEMKEKNGDGRFTLLEWLCFFFRE